MTHPSTLKSQHAKVDAPIAAGRDNSQIDLAAQMTHASDDVASISMAPCAPNGSSCKFRPNVRNETATPFQWTYNGKILDA